VVRLTDKIREDREALENIIGGIFSSTILTLIVLPALCALFRSDAPG
jgi:Cu/Ag efflux pump CusA